MRLTKDASTFCYPENIGREMRELFAWLRQEEYLRGQDADAFSRQAAHFLAELNAIHPFREGNGRTQLTFIALLADQAGHPLDLDNLDAAAILVAMIASFNGDEHPLTAIVRTLVS